MTNERPKTADFAGHCTEITAWQALKETCEQLVERKTFVISPSLIEISEDGHFVLSQTTLPESGFVAPEAIHGEQTESTLSWSLGATLFYIVMGRQVMNGKGGAGQEAQSKLPYLRSEWPELSELVQRCLQFVPEKRPSLQEIQCKAAKQYERCMAEVKRGPKFKSASPSIIQDEPEGSPAFWPEAMQAFSKNVKR